MNKREDVLKMRGEPQIKDEFAWMYASGDGMDVYMFCPTHQVAMMNDGIKDEVMYWCCPLYAVCKMTAHLKMVNDKKANI